MPWSMLLDKVLGADRKICIEACMHMHKVCCHWISARGFGLPNAGGERHTASMSPPANASPTDACSLMLGWGGSIAAAAANCECTAGDAKPPSPTDWISPTCSHVNVFYQRCIPGRTKSHAASVRAPGVAS